MASKGPPKPPPEPKPSFDARQVRVGTIKFGNEIFLNAYELDLWLSRLAQTIHRPLGKPSTAYAFVAECIRTLEKNALKEREPDE